MPKKFFYVLLIVCIVAGAGVTGYGVYTFLNPTKVEAPMPTHEFDSDDQDTFTADPDILDSWKPDTKGAVVGVPSLDIEVPLAKKGSYNGFLDIPKPPKAAWYNQSAEFGDKTGNSIVASHVDSKLQKVVPFKDLHKIEKGTPILVKGSDGKRHEYKASSIKVYDKSGLPDSLFDMSNDHKVALVTCSGETIGSGSYAHYPYNLVVMGEFVK